MPIWIAFDEYGSSTYTLCKKTTTTKKKHTKVAAYEKKDLIISGLWFFKCSFAVSLNHLLGPYYMSAKSKGSGKAALMRRLARAFAGRLCVCTLFHVMVQIVFGWINPYRLNMQMTCNYCFWALKNMCGICAEYERNICGICAEYTRNICGICAEYMRNMCGIYVEYARNICGIYSEYARRSNFSPFPRCFKYISLTLRVELHMHLLNVAARFIFP